MGDEYFQAINDNSPVIAWIHNISLNQQKYMKSKIKDYDFGHDVRYLMFIYDNPDCSQEDLVNMFAQSKGNIAKILKKFEVDSASAGNMINDLKYVNEILVWVFFSEDTKMNVIKANIRSRGPVINEVASKFGGGGHKYASGARLKSWTDADNLIKELDEITSTYSAK